MIKDTKKVLLLSLLITLCCCVFAIFVSKSFCGDNNLESVTIIGGYEVDLDEYIYGDIYFNNDISNLNDLENESEIIAKVKYNGSREKYFQATKTKVSIFDVYKGDSIKSGDSIYIFEPSSLKWDKIVNIGGGYNFIDDNGYYIMFLKSIKIPDGYKYKKDENITYIPVSSFFGKISFSENDIKCVNNDKCFKYNDVKNFDIITTDIEKINTYKELKKKVLNKYSIKNKL